VHELVEADSAQLRAMENGEAKTLWEKTALDGGAATLRKCVNGVVKNIK